jgi:hypothetical protein
VKSFFTVFFTDNRNGRPALKKFPVKSEMNNMKIIFIMTSLLILGGCSTPGKVASQKPDVTLFSKSTVEDTKICIENGWLEEWDTTRSIKTETGYNIFGALTPPLKITSQLIKPWRKALFRK